MAKALPRKVRDNLEKCRAAALAAVDVYNRPGPRFRTAHYIVLIVIAWCGFFHAIAYRKRRNPWYKKPGKTAQGDRYVRVDGEPKHWDLTECLKQHYGPNSPPERKNLEFLVGLRNKIEHRHLPELDASLYGECQAALLNLEEMLEAEFGVKYSLAEQLAVSLQFTRPVVGDKRTSAKRLAAPESKVARDFIDKFRGALPYATLSDIKYSFNVFLVPKVVNRQNAADAAIEFVHVDAASPAELERLQRLNVLIKEKHIPIANLDLYKPTEVVKKVQAKLPHRFTMNSHSAAWRHFKVRPPYKAAKPETTMAQYCIYDQPHNDYLYTNAWIEKLVRELTPVEGYKVVIGNPPTPK
jgi:hypothetical protein